MDWIKTKNILILALIITNLILLYSIVEGRQLYQGQGQTPSKEWEQVIALIRDQGVHYNGPSLPGKATMSGVVLEYQIYDPEVMAETLLEDYSESLGRYTGADGSVMTIENGNRLILDRSKSNNKSGTMTEVSRQQAVRLAEAYLESVRLTSADAKLWQILQNGSMTTVIYKQYQQENFLDEASMVVTLDRGQVIRFERQWFNAAIPLDTERRIISPAKALFRAADQMHSAGEAAPVVIEQMELGYRLDSGAMVTTVKSGEASSYWRIVTQRGTVYYVEAME